MAAALRRTVHGACQDSGLRVDREALELLADLVSQRGEPALHSLLEHIDPGERGAHMLLQSKLQRHSR